MNICKTNDYSKIYECLNNGGVIIIPTETVYGLLVKANEKGKEKLSKIKNRPNDKVYSVIANFDSISKYLTKKSIDILGRISNYSITAILETTKDNIFNMSNIGLRITTNKMLLDLINGYDYPMYLTSANISGLKPIESIDEAYSLFKEEVDLYVDGKLESSNLPTSVIDFTSNPIKILRQGSIKLEDLNL